MALPELFQFQASHFNEKARWALDYKRVPHRRQTLLPGPHKPRMMRLSKQPTVPVLRDGDVVVPGSAAIIDHLERTRTGPSLFPTDPAERSRALEVQRWFDEDVGPEVRVALFHALFVDLPYVAAMFSSHCGPVGRAGFRAIVPAVRLLISRQYRIDDAHAARAREKTRAGLDFVAREAGPSGHLVGRSFSVADLAAAALLAPTVDLPGDPFRYPTPRSPALLGWWAAWSEHPGAAWVRDTYARHRGESAEVASAAA